MRCLQKFPKMTKAIRFNITADCFVAVFNRPFLVWRLRMAEEYRRVDKIGKLGVFLERNIVVDSQAFNRIRAKQFFNRLVDCGGIAVLQIPQERITGFAFHNHQERALAVFARFDKITFVMAELNPVLDNLGSLVDHCPAIDSY